MLGGPSSGASHGGPSSGVAAAAAAGASGAPGSPVAPGSPGAPGEGGGAPGGPPSLQPFEADSLLLAGVSVGLALHDWAVQILRGAPQLLQAGGPPPTSSGLKAGGGPEACIRCALLGLGGGPAGSTASPCNGNKPSGGPRKRGAPRRRHGSAVPSRTEEGSLWSGPRAPGGPRLPRDLSLRRLTGGGPPGEACIDSGGAPGSPAETPETEGGPAGSSLGFEYLPRAEEAARAATDAVKNSLRYFASKSSAAAEGPPAAAEGPLAATQGPPHTAGSRGGPPPRPGDGIVLLDAEALLGAPEGPQDRLPSVPLHKDKCMQGTTKAAAATGASVAAAAAAAASAASATSRDGRSASLTSKPPGPPRVLGTPGSPGGPQGPPTLPKRAALGLRGLPKSAAASLRLRQRILVLGRGPFSTSCDGAAEPLPGDPSGAPASPGSPQGAPSGAPQGATSGASGRGPPRCSSGRRSLGPDAMNIPLQGGPQGPLSPHERGSCCFSSPKRDREEAEGPPTWGPQETVSVAAMETAVPPLQPHHQHSQRRDERGPQRGPHACCSWALSRMRAAADHLNEGRLGAPVPQGAPLSGDSAAAATGSLEVPEGPSGPFAAAPLSPKTCTDTPNQCVDSARGAPSSNGIEEGAATSSRSCCPSSAEGSCSWGPRLPGVSYGSPRQRLPSQSAQGPLGSPSQRGSLGAPQRPFRGSGGPLSPACTGSSSGIQRASVGSFLGPLGAPAPSNTQYTPWGEGAPSGGPLGLESLTIKRVVPTLRPQRPRRRGSVQ